MKILRVFDDRNYDERFSVFTREAVRAIILKDGLIALVRSDREGYYKFPGGGIERGETHLQTLMRETYEETGLRVDPSSVREFGTVIERRRSIFGEKEIFEQRSYYYYADTVGRPGPAVPQGYEAELGYHLEYTDIATAIEVNRAHLRKKRTAFLRRENYVLERLLGGPPGKIHRK